MKKFLIMLTALALIWCLAPAASAAEIVASGKCGENVTWTLDDMGTLTVSGSGAMLKTPSFAQNAEKVKRAVVEEGVTQLGNGLFSSFSNLEKITLPSTLVSIGESVFNNCERLSEVKIPDSVTEIGARAFRYCSSLIEIAIPDGVTGINDAVFSNCSKLVSVALPDSILSIGADAFASCSSLANITIPQNVTSIGKGAFWYCQSLPRIVIPGSVADIGKVAFHQCSSLQSLILSEGVTAIREGAFGMCSSLTFVTLPDSLTTLEARAFAKCSSLAEVVLGKGLTAISEDVFANCTGLEKVTIPHGVVSIEKGAFYCCQSLAGIVIPGSVVDIGTRAFYQCSSLQSLVLTEGITTIGEGAFGKCTSLTSVTLPDSLTAMEVRAFVGCSSLMEVVLGEGVTTISEDAFSNCTSLTRVTIPHSVTSLEKGAFYQCTSLTELVLSDSLTTIGEAAFAYCTSLTDFTLPQSITSIERSAFAHCTSLTNITLPEGLVTISRNAFGHCSNLASVTIPDSVTSVGICAFFKCSSLTSITLPSQVTFLGNDAFCGCTKLKTVYFQGDAPVIDYDCFEFMIGSTIYYPQGNPTWTEDIMQHYGGYLYWEPYCDHLTTESIAAVVPTCTASGLTEGQKCTVCGNVLLAQEDIPAAGHSFSEGSCSICGEADPDWNTEPTRLAGSHRFDTAFLAADKMKQNLGIEKFNTVVVASGMDFADALSGSYLAAVNNAPILLACQVESINDTVKAYIKENLNPGGTVYILGGTNAIPASFQTGLEAFTVNRLAGANRFDTNLMVLREAGVGDKTILVATGLNFADCPSASAAKLPILLVYGDKLLDDQAAYLNAPSENPLCIIGGTGAVSEALEAQLASYGTVERLAGSNRFETSVMIAEKFFTNPDSAVLAYAWNFPDGLCGGPLAATMNAPLILTMPKYESHAAEYIQDKQVQSGIILGGETLIPNASVGFIFSLK